MFCTPAPGHGIKKSRNLSMVGALLGLSGSNADYQGIAPNELGIPEHTESRSFRSAQWTTIDKAWNSLSLLLPTNSAPF